MTAKSGPDTGAVFDKAALTQEIIEGLGLLHLSLEFGGKDDFTEGEFRDLYDGFMEATSKRALYSILMSTFMKIHGGPVLLAALTKAYHEGDVDE